MSGYLNFYKAIAEFSQTQDSELEDRFRYQGGGPSALRDALVLLDDRSLVAYTLGFGLAANHFGTSTLNP